METPEMIPAEGLPKAAATEPMAVEFEVGKTYAWCTCGLSEKIALCDGKHKQVEGMPFRSLKVTAEESGEVWLCTCKQTKNPPYCDGSHNQLKP